MKRLTISEALLQIAALIDDIAVSHRPVRIEGKRGEAVLATEEDLRALQETLFLNSNPNLRLSIIEGMRSPVEACSNEPGW